jgi:hypothetical protein
MGRDLDASSHRRQLGEAHSPGGRPRDVATGRYRKGLISEELCLGRDLLYRRGWQTRLVEADQFPRGRVLTAAVSRAHANLLSLTGMLMTSLLFAVGDAVWPPGEGDVVASRVGHDVGVVARSVALLWLAAGARSVLAHNRLARRRWAPSMFVDGTGRLMVGIEALEMPPIDLRMGPLEARVRRPSGEIYVYRRGAGLDGGIVGRERTMHSFVLPGLTQDGEYEVRWYRQPLGRDRPRPAARPGGQWLGLPVSADGGRAHRRVSGCLELGVPLGQSDDDGLRRIDQPTFSAPCDPALQVGGRVGAAADPASSVSRGARFLRRGVGCAVLQC